jgi:hypothetical protein
MGVAQQPRKTHANPDPGFLARTAACGAPGDSDDPARALDKRGRARGDFAALVRVHPGTVTILTWGGLREGISVALALSLPASREREIVLATT